MCLSPVHPFDSFLDSRLLMIRFPRPSYNQFTSREYPTHPLAIYHQPSSKHDHQPSSITVYPDTFSVPGLLEIFILATFLLASGASMGDHGEKGFFAEVVADGVGESIGEAIVKGLFGGH